MGSKAENYPDDVLEGRIDGTQKIGNMWMNPVETDRPVDERVKTGKYIKEKKT